VGPPGPPPGGTEAALPRSNFTWYLKYPSFSRRTAPPFGFSIGENPSLMKPPSSLTGYVGWPWGVTWMRTIGQPYAVATGLAGSA
jgi:hypothetical protein